MGTISIENAVCLVISMVAAAVSIMCAIVSRR